MQTLDETVARVCHLACNFYAVGNPSPSDLFKASGYREHRDAVGESILHGYLSRHSELIDGWRRYSEDKRCDGWYFAEEPGGTYRVGHAPKVVSKNERRFADRAEACAAFVKCEMESLVKTGSRPVLLVLLLWSIAEGAKAFWRAVTPIARGGSRGDDGYIGHG